MDVDTVAKTGQVYFDASNSLTNTANEWRIYAESGATEPAATDPLGSQAVWSTGDYRLIDHEAKGVDTSPYATTSQVINNVTAGLDGKIGKSSSYDGTTSYIEYQNAPFGYIDHLYNSETIVMSGWIQPDSVHSGTIVGRGILQNDEGVGAYVSSDGGIKYQAREGTTIATAEAVNANYANVWTHFVGVRTPTETRIYINGVLANTVAGSFSTAHGDDFYLGASDGGSGGSERFFYSGLLNEIKVTVTEYSSNYIETEYNNQSSPETF